MGFGKDKEEAVDKPVKKKADKEEDKKEQIMVVKELPTQSVRQSTDEETGIVTTFVTIEEALQSLMGGKL